LPETAAVEFEVRRGAKAFAVTLRIADGQLVLEHRERRIEVPCSAITRLSAWTIPLPGGGLWLSLRSGRRFPYGLQIADPTALLLALAAAGGPADGRGVLEHPNVIYARAKTRRSRWYHPLLKFVGFAFLVTLPLFRVHQYIAYGGTFGEYYLMGLQAYLITFGIYWGAPSRAARVRRAVEIVYRVLYYGGVPVLVTLRFLPW